jgi:hypothetical protein
MNTALQISFAHITAMRKKIYTLFVTLKNNFEFGWIINNVFFKKQLNKIS